MSEGVSPTNGSKLIWAASGAAAGLAVDLSLYPLDTLKTRLQSEVGFKAAGGFRHLYRGIGSVAIGSAPGAALFFLGYEQTKRLSPNAESPYTQMAAACLGEIAACTVRVPTELVKQRAQANKNQSLPRICREVLAQRGVLGFYQGYVSTVLREIPFSLVQFPVWEALKRAVAKRSDRQSATPFESAACGAVSGAFSGVVTTPLDVAKTRIMLSTGAERDRRILVVLREVYRNSGLSGLWAGATARATWLALGGFVFLGAYQTSEHALQNCFR